MHQHIMNITPPFKYKYENNFCAFRYNEKGNALFLILIAVALFAALSYAVTQSGRGGGNINRETTEIAAAQIIQFSANVKQAITRLQLISNCSDTDLNFESSQTGTDYQSLTSPADGSCNLFTREGSNVTYIEPNPTFLDNSQSSQPNFGEWLITGESCVYNVGATDDFFCFANGSTDDSELIIALPYITQSICTAINRNLGIPTRPIPRANNQTWENPPVRFIGTYSEGGHAIQSDDTDRAALDGEVVGCFEGEIFPPLGTYHFYQVLIAR